MSILVIKKICIQTKKHRDTPGVFAFLQSLSTESTSGSKYLLLALLTFFYLFVMNSSFLAHCALPLSVFLISEQVRFSIQSLQYFEFSFFNLLFNAFFSDSLFHPAPSFIKVFIFYINNIPFKFINVKSDIKNFIVNLKIISIKGERYRGQFARTSLDSCIFLVL